MKKILWVVVVNLLFISCKGQKKIDKNVEKQNPKIEKVTKSTEEWQKILTPMQFDVLRNKETERPFTGEYVTNFEKGQYVCAGCSNVLFLSDAKFDSDCGWPSFDKAIKGSVNYITDNTFGMERIEVVCAKCDGHLGHVFKDGPTNTGDRFCTNSVSIKFIPKKI